MNSTSGNPSVKPSASNPALLTVEQVAALCHVSRETVRRWARSGVVDARRVVSTGRSRWLISMAEGGR